MDELNAGLVIRKGISRDDYTMVSFFIACLILRRFELAIYCF
jgi:hypothetical protein